MIPSLAHRFWEFSETIVDSLCEKSPARGLILISPYRDDVMNKILISWQLFRQSLVLRTADNLESWLNRWCYGDDGALLIGRGVSLNEQQNNRTVDHDQAIHKTTAAPPLIPHPPMRVTGNAKPIILPMHRRLIDCFHEL